MMVTVFRLSMRRFLRNKNILMLYIFDDLAFLKSRNQHCGGLTLIIRTFESYEQFFLVRIFFCSLPVCARVKCEKRINYYSVHQFSILPPSDCADLSRKIPKSGTKTVRKEAYSICISSSSTPPHSIEIPMSSSVFLKSRNGICNTVPRIPPIWCIPQIPNLNVP
jgi:hypothetical protein